MIWFRNDIELSQLKSVSKGTMADFLGMEFTEVGEDYLKMKMPVNGRTVQPYGYLHGGANCALIETIGSLASALAIDTNRFGCVGLEINANHIRSVTKGWVTATATPLHLGRTTHVWDVKVHTDAGKLSCVGRLTVSVFELKSRSIFG